MIEDAEWKRGLENRTQFVLSPCFATLSSANISEFPIERLIRGVFHNRQPCLAVIQESELPPNPNTRQNESKRFDEKLRDRMSIRHSAPKRRAAANDFDLAPRNPGG